MEWDVPYAGETVPFGDLASFVARAGALGAGPDTPVLAAASQQDESVIVALRLELDEGELKDRSSVVCVDRISYEWIVEMTRHQAGVPYPARRVTGIRPPAGSSVYLSRIIDLETTIESRSAVLPGEKGPATACRWSHFKRAATHRPCTTG
jgi:hypothetical protein